MRYTFWLIIPILSACTPQNTYQSPRDQIVQKCTAAGYKDKEFDDCVSTATDAYIAEFNRQTAQENQERIKAEKAAKAAQLADDSAKCKGYGFKKGTKDFAGCMMQIEQTRQQAQRQQEVLTAQMAAQQQAIAIQQQALQQQRAQELGNNISNIFKNYNYVPPVPQNNTMRCRTYTNNGSTYNTDCY